MPDALSGLGWAVGLAALATVASSIGGKHAGRGWTPFILERFVAPTLYIAAVFMLLRLVILVRH